MTEKVYVSSRGSVHYWVHKCEAGDCPAVLVFLHGLTADHRLFEQQTGVLSKKYSVLVWDAPAHGRSRPYSDFSYGNLAEDLKQILDAEAFDRVVLIGQSMGGFVAQSFLSRYPDRAAGFVAIDTCPYRKAYYSRSDLWWLKQIEWMANLFPDGVLRKVMAKQCGYGPYARRKMLDMLENYSKKELCHLMYLGFAGFIPELHDLNISCPVCLILGEHDKTGKIRIYNKRWHREAGYPLHMIPKAAHNANEDNPEAVNVLIETFLSNIL